MNRTLAVPYLNHYEIRSFFFFKKSTCQMTHIMITRYSVRSVNYVFFLGWRSLLGVNAQTTSLSESHENSKISPGNPIHISHKERPIFRSIKIFCIFFIIICINCIILLILCNAFRQCTSFFFKFSFSRSRISVKYSKYFLYYSEKKKIL